MQKLGRTTSVTTGTVTGINATVIVRYDKGRARFVDQIIVENPDDAFSAGGDSGSLIVTNDGNNNPVALLFAGSDSHTVGNPIDLVLAAFNVTIDGAAPPDPTPTPTPDPNATPTPTPTATATPTPTPTSTPTPVPGATPVVDACNPNNGSNGDQLIVAVTGSNFQDGATADFGKRVKVQNVTFVSSGLLDVQIKVHPKASSGPRDVTVTNPDKQSGTQVGCFTVN